MKLIEMKGKIFGELTVLEYAGNYKWKCQCSCGNISYPTGYNLRSGNAKSCGCRNMENLRKAITTHGKRHTKIYSIWCHIKGRCYNQNRDNYKYYGAKGIKVCDEWRDNFISFYEWAMSHGYKDGLEIDRIDNKKDYCPENCRFATRKMQVRNRSNTLYVQFNGKTVRFFELCEKFNVNYKSAHGKYKGGVPLREIFDCGSMRGV